MTNQEKMKRLYEIQQEIAAYGRAIGKLSYDMSCACPPEGMEQAGKDMALLGKHVFALEHDSETVQLICELHEDGEGLSELEKKFVDYLYIDYKKTKNFSPEFSYNFDCAKNLAYAKWLEAKKAADFSLFRDALAEVIRYTREAVELRDEKPARLYDACLDDYERGSNMAQDDAFFEALKAAIVPLLRRIQSEGKPIRTDFLSRKVPVSDQEAISHWIVEQEGIRGSAFSLSTTEHPFTTSFGMNDVRIATHYHEENYVSNLFSMLHEGGHALFMQCEPKEFEDTLVYNHMTNGMHECVSRFFENSIGRSKGFIHFAYPAIQSYSKGVFDDISEQEFYEAVNVAQPDLIRTEADELTYALHICIRYELEKGLINGEIGVDDIPRLWNAKYKEYLGVEVPDDARGCLQDVHWTDSFGYFPSYALGSAYGAQILAAMNREFDVDKAVAEGRLCEVSEWFKKRVFARASLLSPDEWLTELTGEKLNVQYFIDYLNDKFTALYGLK